MNNIQATCVPYLLCPQCDVSVKYVPCYIYIERERGLVPQRGCALLDTEEQHPAFSLSQHLPHFLREQPCTC